MEDATALEYAIDDGMGEILVVQHRAPRLEWLVGREDHRPPALVTIIDDVEEHVSGVRAVGKVADFIDNQDVRMGVSSERLAEAALAKRCREFVDEFGGDDEQSVEAVLHGTASDGHS